MPHTVVLTDAAAHDLEELFDHIERHDGLGKALHVVDRIEKSFNGLVEYPHRGTYPKELLELGIRDFREVFFKPYRILYRVIDQTVYILLIADGRRDMQSLLQRRLLDA